MERICTKCGNPIDEGDSFCDVCGAKFEETQTEEKVAVGVKAHDNEAAAEKKPAGANRDQALGFVKQHKEKVIFVAVAVAVILIGVIIVSMIAANTPEAALKKAIGYRLSGNVNGSVSIDYESNFSKAETQSQALSRLKGNADLTTKRNAALKIRIISETRVQDDKTANTTDLTNRVNELSSGYNDTDKITDIRNLSYNLVDENDEVKMSGTAQAIKVNGKWYILGVAQVALNF